ncbi:MAG: chemotaxis protein [Lachnospiraceae bacterium]|nr:chemotaxis protein [Lachnospiraceae bacterium]
MPKGEPSKQSIATRKYEAKAGWMSKTYKLKRDVVTQFAEACDKAGVSQASQLTKMMMGFIEKNK